MKLKILLKNLSNNYVYCRKNPIPIYQVICHECKSKIQYKSSNTNFDDIEKIIEEIKKLQTYKLFEKDKMLLVNLEEVIEILTNHIKSTLQKPKTNAEKFQFMSIEEIETWYWWMHKEMMNYTDSHEFVHEWLKGECK